MNACRRQRPQGLVGNHRPDFAEPTPTDLISMTCERFIMNPQTKPILSVSGMSRSNMSRRGISVIEVLTSILVATIGVAGVMVMIPFAVGQAEQGFDQEAATAFGKNFADEFELRGFHQPAYWTSATPPPIANTAKIANGFVVDPIGTTGTPGTNAFPYVSNLTAADAPTTIAIERTNVNMIPGNAGSAASPELARTLFSWRNDLVYGPPDKAKTAAAGYTIPEFAPAETYFDVSGGNLLRRQFEGELSCVVFCLPDFVGVKASGDPFVSSWRSYTVVYRRRPLPTSNLRRPYDRVFNAANTIPSEQILYGGGELLLTNGDFATSNANSSQLSVIRRGDWIALTNGTTIQQLNFYRVLDATEEPPPAVGSWRVTLQGPDFDLTPGDTYAIHLPDVWAVIERTYQVTN